MQIRLAEEEDIDQLIRMRWDFHNEYSECRIGEDSYGLFYTECKIFLTEALRSRRWFIWVAVTEGRIASHIYLERIDKLPRPGRSSNSFAYMTNVYTLPEWRREGIGSRLLNAIELWSKEQVHEFIIVWPSEWSRSFYERNGYLQCKEPMELMLELDT